MSGRSGEEERHRMVCPPWVGYLLLNPLRRLFENPEKILARFVLKGMVVLEPGCGMGYFTLPLARMVGPGGKIVAVDVQSRMLSALDGRARRAGLMDRIILRRATPEGLGIEDFSGRVDFCAAIHMVHEVADEATFFKEVWEALKPGGKLLIIEPKAHVNAEAFEGSIGTAEKIGFDRDPHTTGLGRRGALLIKTGS